MRAVPGQSNMQTSGGAGLVVPGPRWDTGALVRWWESPVLVLIGEERSRVGWNETQVFAGWIRVISGAGGNEPCWQAA